MQKISISITPELHSALIRASLDNGVSVSRIVDNYLKEHNIIRKYIEEIRAEPDIGVFAVNPKRIHIDSKKELIASS